MAKERSKGQDLRCCNICWSFFDAFEGALSSPALMMSFCSLAYAVLEETHDLEEVMDGLDEVMDDLEDLTDGF